MPEIKDLENAPWPKFCREAMERNICKVCTNPEHAEFTISFATETGKAIYCNLKCDKRTPVDALPQNSCQNCKNGKSRDEHGYPLWMCSKYSEYRAHKCRTDRFKEWEDGKI